MVDCADAANRGNDNGANTVCHAEQQSQLLQQFAQPTGSGELRTEFFGLYAFSGKATAFIGPLVLGWVTLAFDSQRAGMATIIIFLVVGVVLLQRVTKV